MVSEQIRVEIRFKNATLYNALLQRFPYYRGKHGRCYLGMAEAARHLGVSYTHLIAYLNLRISPWLANGSPTPMAEKLSLALEIPVEELFPIRLYQGHIPKRLAMEIDGSRYLSLAEARQQKLLPSSTEELGSQKYPEELLEKLNEVLGTLTPRQGQVIELRFGLSGNPPLTQAEVSRELGYGRQRVFAIEHRALRGLRHPSRCAKLRDFVDWEL